MKIDNVKAMALCAQALLVVLVATFFAALSNDVMAVFEYIYVYVMVTIAFKLFTAYRAPKAEKDADEHVKM